VNARKNMERFLKRKAPDINWEEEIKYDPGLRKEIDSYHPNPRDYFTRLNVLQMKSKIYS